MRTMTCACENDNGRVIALCGAHAQYERETDAKFFAAHEEEMQKLEREIVNIKVILADLFIAKATGK